MQNIRQDREARKNLNKEARTGIHNVNEMQSISSYDNMHDHKGNKTRETGVHTEAKMIEGQEDNIMHEIKI